MNKRAEFDRYLEESTAEFDRYLEESTADFERYLETLPTLDEIFSRIETAEGQEKGRKRENKGSKQELKS